MNVTNRNRLRRDTISTPGEELGRIDQAPVDVFKCLAAITDAGDVTSADFDFMGRRLPGQDAKVDARRVPCARWAPCSRISPRTVPGLACSSAVDQGAIHQEQGLRNRAQHVVVGNGGIDSEQAVKEQPLAAGTCGRPRPSCRLAMTAQRPRRLSWHPPLFSAWSCCRLGSPRLKLA